MNLRWLKDIEIDELLLAMLGAVLAILLFLAVVLD